MDKARQQFNRIVDLNKWYEDLIKNEDRSVVCQKLSDRCNYSSDVDRNILNEILFRELEITGQYDKASALICHIIEKKPTEIMHRIAYAGLLLYFMEAPAEALATVEQAMKIANKTGQFRRLALGVKGRIALVLDRYDLLVDVLRDISELGWPLEDDHDIDPERDFFDRAERHRLPLDVVHKFEKFMEKHVLK